MEDVSRDTTSQAVKAKKILKILVSIIGVLIPILLPDAFVPFQLDSFRLFGSAFGVAFALVSLVYSPLSESTLKIIAILAGLSAIGLLILSIAFVEVVPVEADKDRPVLVGFQYTDMGRLEIENEELIQESRNEIVSRLGYDRIPFIWGWSYSVVLWSMAVCFLILIGCIIVGIIAISSVKRGIF